MAESSPLEALLNGLKSEQVELRLEAVRGLAEYGAAPEVVTALVQALGDVEVSVRVEASRAIKPLGSTAVPVLCEALQDDNLALRRHAAMVLGTLGVAASEAMSVLASLEGDPIVGEEAARALARIQKGVIETGRREDTGGIIISWVIVLLFLGLQLGGTPFLFKQVGLKKEDQIASNIALGWGVIATLAGAIIGGSRHGQLGVLVGGVGFGLAGSLIGSAIGYVVGKSLGPLIGCLFWAAAPG